MQLNCEQVQEMLAEYLDNSLLPEDRQRLQLHLDRCESCQKDLELQQQWLHEKRPLLLRDPEFQSAADLSQRIRASLSQLSADTDEAAAAPLPDRGISGKRTWPMRLALTAAAVLVLFLGVNIFTDLYQKTLDNELMSIPFQAAGGDAAAEAGADGLSVDEKRLEDETDPMIDLGSDQPAIMTPSLLRDTGWSIYQGSLADLPTGGGLFVRPSTDPVSEETTETTLTASEDTGGSVNPESEPAAAAADLLTGAQAVRVLIRPDPPGTLIYSFWQDQDGEDFWQQIQTERFNWPYRTDIVRMPAEDEAVRMRELLGSELAAAVLEGIELENGEIIQILIGE